MTSRTTRAKAAAAAYREENSDNGNSSAEATKKRAYSNVVALRPPSPTSEETIMRNPKGETSAVKPVNDDRSLDDDPNLTRISTIDKQQHESKENEGGDDPEPIPDKGKAIDPREWGNLEISDGSWTPRPKPRH